jgi:hypothetical protein
MAQRKDDWIKASDVYLSITKKHRPSGETVRQWFGELVRMGKGEIKGNGRSLQFRVFSDKNPPPTLPPEGSKTKLDDLRQELDELSNPETTNNQEVQEFLDKLDNLDDFPKNEISSLPEVHEKLLGDKVAELNIQAEEEENQLLGKLSNLSNNVQDVELASDTALDDFLDKSSNLDADAQIDSGGRKNWTPGTKFRVTGRDKSYKEHFGKILTVKFNDQARSVIEAEETNHRFAYWCVELAPTEELLEVGDMVFWSECPAHCSSLAPFQVTSIDGDYAKLDLFEKSVRLADLSRA